MAELKTHIFVTRKPDKGNLFIKECALRYFELSRLAVPAELTLLRDGKGKPYFEGNPVFVSYSHSGDMVAAAVSPKPVGVDIEQKKLRNFSELSERFCGAKLDGESFYRRWVGAEAAFKALGGAVTDFLRHDPANITYYQLENYLIGVYAETESVPPNFSY